MKKILTVLCVWICLLIFSSCSSTDTASNDIIQQNSDFLYFYGITCTHCQELNTLLEQKDMYSKVSIEKREVYRNSQNSLLFQAVAKKLWVAPEDMAVPFVLDRRTREYVTGVGPAMALFETRINQASPQEQWETQAASWAIQKEDWVQTEVESSSSWELQDTKNDMVE